MYRRKICLIWKFSKINKIKLKIISSMKIYIVFHQIWQIFYFQIRVLNDMISMMIKKRLNNKILKSCYDSYRNFWFLIKKKKSKNINLSISFSKWIELLFEILIFFFSLMIFWNNSLIIWWFYSWIYFSIMIKFFWLKPFEIWLIFKF